jgi:hypothetical protein
MLDRYRSLVIVEEVMTGVSRMLRELTRRLDAYTLWAFNPQPELARRPN